jgi:hypothetical protein
MNDVRKAAKVGACLKILSTGISLSSAAEFPVIAFREFYEKPLRRSANPTREGRDGANSYFFSL